MTDLDLEDAAEAQAYQAKEVRFLLAHEGLKIAFQRTRDRVLKQWEAAQTVEERERCWHKLAAFRDLQTELRAFGDRPSTDR